RDPEQVTDYRGAEAALILRARKTGRLLLSAKPLGERYRRQIGHYVLLTIGLLAFLVVFTIVAVGFHSRMLFGERALGTVTRVERFTGKGARCEFEIRTPPGNTFDDDASADWCNVIKRGDSVPIIHI